MKGHIFTQQVSTSDSTKIKKDMDGDNLYFKTVQSTKVSGRMTPYQDMVDLLEMTVIMREMWRTVEQMDQELMKTIIGIIQGNGKMIKEMG